MAVLVTTETQTLTTDILERLTPKQARLALEQVLRDSLADRVPTATYRVQFGADFTFTSACQHAAYLHALGVSDLYGSPFFHATSPHGYDINAHDQVNPALGGEAELKAIMAELKRLGMGYLLDVVPNHMGIEAGDNLWWHDVLENGQASPYATYFDIDWYPLRSEMHGQVLLPILGNQYGRTLHQGEIRLELDQGALCVRYGARLLPIDPGTYSQVLQPALEQLEAQCPATDPDLMEFQSILTALRHLPPRTEEDSDKRAERQREKEITKQRLAALLARANKVQTILDHTIAHFNGTPGTPASFDHLDSLLAAQPYRLAFWRVAAEEINYRRFFDINGLAAIRMECPAVFDAAHHLVKSLIAEGSVTGLRIDHPDGLWDPAAYFQALQQMATAARAQALLASAGETLSDQDLALLHEVATAMTNTIATARPLYIVAEKIVEHGEALPDDWAIHGTTGYEFLNVLGGLFVDRESETQFTQSYTEFIGETLRFHEIVYAAKQRVLRTAMASELNVLAHALGRLAQCNRLYRDFTLGNLTEGLREIIAAFPVYRSYINEQTVELTPHDRDAIEKAVRLAQRRNTDLDPSLFAFLRNLLLLELPEMSAQDSAEQRRFVMKFQQLTGPVMAKGLEDTAFYRYNRLVALNEVGGNAGIFGTEPADFHRYNQQQHRAWPHTLLCTSTHDTKRSEDVRARIAVLSEMPANWRDALERWSKINASKKRQEDDEFFPSRNDEYLLYQSLLGAWPLGLADQTPDQTFGDRMVAYLTKAANEAKVHTSWINPNTAYDEALERFVRLVLADKQFLRDFGPFQHHIAFYGALNSLAQVTLKLAAPGVPDIYQGNECWDFSLVDPDNRRPVAWEANSQALQHLTQQAEGGNLQELAQQLTETWTDGRIKLWITHRALIHRRANPDLYRDGSYQPIEAVGPAARHLVAFARNQAQQSLVAIAPRLLYRLAAQTGTLAQPDHALTLPPEVWRETSLPLPPGRYRNLFTAATIDSDGSSDSSVAIATLLGRFPVALLEKGDKR